MRRVCRTAVGWRGAPRGRPHQPARDDERPGGPRGRQRPDAQLAPSAVQTGEHPRLRREDACVAFGRQALRPGCASTRRSSRRRERSRRPGGCRRSTTSARTPLTWPRRSRRATPTSSSSRPCATRASPRAPPRRSRSSCSALGQALPGDGNKVALEHAHDICTLADLAGTTVTLDMEDHTTTDLDAGGAARAAGRLPDRRSGSADLPASDGGGLPRPRRHGLPGSALQGRLQGARVGGIPVRAATSTRPTSGASRSSCTETATRWSPPTTRASSRSQVRSRPRQDVPRHPSSTRCSTASGPRNRSGSPTAADQMRVYIPYGEEWYGYLMRRMAEKPANVMFFLRGLATRG